ncbi:hypothetical protein OROHE_017876 [Orobanche hederae]
MNTCPHTMSLGGYDLVDEKIMAEKLKKRQEEASQSRSDAVVDHPSPPTRHQRCLYLAVLWGSALLPISEGFVFGGALGFCFVTYF